MDMKDIIQGLGYPKTLDFGAKDGAFNVLNVPTELAKTDQFWATYNKPFLDAAIARGDDIVLATPLENIYESGKLTGFGKEIKYLEQQGYHYVPETKMIVKLP